jgi:hypothetical protein
VRGMGCGERPLVRCGSTWKSDDNRLGRVRTPTHTMDRLV